MKTEANVCPWENSRADQWNLSRSRRFSPAREFSLTLSRFSPGYEGTENMFYFFYEMIIFCFNKEKDDIRSEYEYLKFFHETVTSHNLETEATILLTSFSCFIALWKHTCTCRPIQTQVVIASEIRHYAIQCHGKENKLINIMFVFLRNCFNCLPVLKKPLLRNFLYNWNPSVIALNMVKKKNFYACVVCRKGNATGLRQAIFNKS